MKENKYDDPVFFEAYSGFPRSVEGLRAAGEWHVMKRMLPPFEGKRVLDIGCGFGWHCAYACEQGASYVLGTDISRNMIEGAKERNPGAGIEYRCVDMESLDLPDGSFDVVISSLAFHYTPELEDMFRRIYRWLAPGGTFVFSVEHPVFTAEGSQNWAETAGGGTVWPVDRYFSEGKRTADFLGSRVTKYHRTLTGYITALLDAGFILTGFEEPKPAPELLETVPAMKEELRRPMMAIFSAVKGAFERVNPPQTAVVYAHTMLRNC